MSFRYAGKTHCRPRISTIALYSPHRTVIVFVVIVVVAG